MDDGDPPLTARSSCPPVLAHSPEAAGNKPRSWARRNASKLLGFFGLVRREGLFRKFVELTCPNILFDLPVPLVRVVRAKPLSKSSELGAAELLDLLFELLDFCHAPSPPPGASSHPRPSLFWSGRFFCSVEDATIRFCHPAHSVPDGDDEELCDGP